ncbi:MAG: PilZ domain-containing protein [Rhodanobacter sp.]
MRRAEEIHPPLGVDVGALTQQQQLADRNAGTLAAVAALEERHAEVDDDSPLMQEMQRMDAKLTALVDIVNHLLVPSNALPPRQLVRFNAIGAIVPATMVPASDGGLVLRLRFEVCRALPLELAARVVSLLDQDRAYVQFASLGDVLGDAIERLVFRHHRRKVAETRQMAP